jgi:hypothetical protein
MVHLISDDEDIINVAEASGDRHQVKLDHTTSLEPQ